MTEMPVSSDEGSVPVQSTSLEPDKTSRIKAYLEELKTSIAQQKSISAEDRLEFVSMVQDISFELDLIEFDASSEGEGASLLTPDDVTSLGSLLKKSNDASLSKDPSSARPFWRAILGLAKLKTQLGENPTDEIEYATTLLTEVTLNPKIHKELQGMARSVFQRVIEK